MKLFECASCGQVLYFENTRCLQCGRELGYLPEEVALSPLEPAVPGQWKALASKHKTRSFRKCRNYEEERVCNWMVDAGTPDAYCSSCALNEIIPNLSKSGNRSYWHRVEVAKRRLLYTLRTLRLPIVGRTSDPARGLAFRFLEDVPATIRENRKILTGHAGGVITINLAEADDAFREKMRLDMNERYRTLLGHFRHEIAHYYWPEVIERGGRIDDFRALFGDERADYDAALKRHYKEGPPSDWQERCVSRYATSHPWEDWAETWGHYLHMVDALETAQALRIDLRARIAMEPGQLPKLAEIALELDSFDEMCGAWFTLTIALNSMNRSIGLKDFYPFALSKVSLEKLRFVHDVIVRSRG